LTIEVTVQINVPNFNAIIWAAVDES